VTLVGDDLILLGERGRLALVEATPDRFRLVTERVADEEFALQPNCWAAPIVAGGKLFVRGRKKIGCFELVNDQPSRSVRAVPPAAASSSNP
jgi:hypothetical protein